MKSLLFLIIHKKNFNLDPRKYNNNDTKQKLIIKG